MAEPLKKNMRDVFEDFPLPERKHFDAHRAARGSLGAGLAPMNEEKQQFAHLKRDSSSGVGEQSSADAPLLGGCGSNNDNAWKSSYQAFADGTDDIGQVRRLSRKKSHSSTNGNGSSNGSARSEINLFTGRSFLSHGRENAENQRKSKIPGYTGFVPQVCEMEMRTVVCPSVIHQRRSMPEL